MAQHTFLTTGVVVTEPHYTQTAPDNGVCKFRMKSSRSVRDEDSWKEYDTLWVQVECWGKLAENVRRSIDKKMHVMVAGTMVTHEFQTENQEKRSYTVLKANYVGPDLNRYIAGCRLNVPTQIMGDADLVAGENQDSDRLEPWIDASCIDDRYTKRKEELERKANELEAMKEEHAKEAIAAV